MKFANPFKSRKTIVRTVLIVLYVALGALMLISGKSHTILIDNKDADDGSYLAIDGMSVQIDNQESSEYYPGDRDKALVKGQKHSIKVEIFSEEKKIEKTFTVPLGQEMVLLSVPKMVNGVEPFIQPFTIQQEQASIPDSGQPEEQQFGGDEIVVPDTVPESPAEAVSPMP